MWWGGEEGEEEVCESYLERKEGVQLHPSGSRTAAQARCSAQVGREEEARPPRGRPPERRMTASLSIL